VIPTKTAYTRASSVDEALAAIRDGAKPIAGGQSLIPMMRLRLAAPESLVDIGGIAELRGIREEGGVIIIGAATRHREVAASDAIRRSCPVISDAAAGIGSPAVRNRGTIGGSLAHADPHADLPAALLAVGGAVTVRGAGGTRMIAAADLVVDYLTTSLAEDEMIVDARVPADAAQSAYAKFHRRAIDWSIIGAAAAVRNGQIAVAITGLGLAPVRASGFEAVVNGGGSLEDAAREAGAGTNPIDDLDGSAEYKRHLAGVLAKRAVEAARAR
jgi:aerobic carbon-monoxide dehydrogenase medium subunit